MNNRVTVKEAAELLGVSEQFVRIGMQRDKLPIGTAVKLSTKCTYHIPRERLNAYLKGLDIKKPPCGNMTADPLGKPAERT